MLRNICTGFFIINIVFINQKNHESKINSIFLVSVSLFFVTCSKQETNEQFEITTFEEFKAWAGDDLKPVNDNNVKGYDIYMLTFHTDKAAKIAVRNETEKDFFPPLPCDRRLYLIGEILTCQNQGSECGALGDGTILICDMGALARIITG